MIANLLIAVVLTAWTCAGAEKLLSAEDLATNVPDAWTHATNATIPTNFLGGYANHAYTTNLIDYHWTSIGVSHVLTTNVSERWPTHLENDFSRPWTQATVQNAIGYMKWEPDPNPTNKWIRTTIKRQTLVDFTVEGTPFRGLLKEETLFDREVEWWLERKDAWLERPR